MSRFKLVLIMFLVGIAFCGCGRKDTAVTTLRMSSWGNEAEETNLRNYITEFEKLHPKIKVELEIVPWARVFDKLMISTAGGRPPDISRISSEWYSPLADKGLLEPLDPYVKRYHYDLTDFYPQSINSWGRYHGKLYTIPTDIDIMALYYNKTMFDKYHLPYPDWSWDWDRYVEVARMLTKDLNDDGVLDQWGCSVDVWWQSYIYQNGGTILNSDNTKCTLDQPSAYEAVQFLSDLVNKFHVAPNQEESGLVGNRKLFTSGKIGMYVSGSYMAELVFPVEIKDFIYDVGPIPKGPKARATFIGGAAWGMLSRSNHKKEAWELLKWMTGKHYQQMAAIKSQIIPSRMSVAKSGAYLKLKRPPLHREVFLQMIPYGRTLPHVDVSQELNSIISGEIELVLLGRESGKQACEKVTPVVDQLLRTK